MLRKAANLPSFLACLAVAAGCGTAQSAGPGSESGSGGGEGRDPSGGNVGAGGVPDGAVVVGEDAEIEVPASVVGLGGPGCVDLSCLGCASGTECAAEGPFIGDSCCAVGDNLLHIGSGSGSEVVDLEVDGTFAITCGGFGAQISDITDAAAPRFVGSASPRCQRIGIGRKLDDGTRVFYLAHHGDSWVTSPSLWTYHLSPDGDINMVDEKTDPSVLFEGMAYHEGYLYVAAHGGGIRVYQTGAQGVPTLLRTVGGFANAWKLDIVGEHAYVADYDAGVRVLSLADPTKPVVLTTLPTAGPARDVDAHGDKVFVAMGGAGVDVFDISSPAAPKHVRTIVGDGSAQAVAADGDLLAIANWNHVALRDTRNYHLIGTERVRRAFEQDLGVALSEGTVFVGEWEGLHVLRHRPGYVAPDIRITEDVFTLPVDRPSARSVVLENRGSLPLEVRSINIGEVVGDGSILPDPAFEVSPDALTIAPGEGDFFQFTLADPKETSAQLLLGTNDPDRFQTRYSIPVEVAESDRLSVGDKLTEEFGFLDPNDAGQLSGLEGHVVMLAYFALF